MSVEGQSDDVGTDRKSNLLKGVLTVLTVGVSAELPEGTVVSEAQQAGLPPDAHRLHGDAGPVIWTAPERTHTDGLPTSHRLRRRHSAGLPAHASPEPSK